MKNVEIESEAYGKDLVRDVVGIMWGPNRCWRYMLQGISCWVRDVSGQSTVWSVSIKTGVKVLIKTAVFLSG
jgi:hypothetical protein